MLDMVASATLLTVGAGLALLTVYDLVLSAGAFISLAAPGPAQRRRRFAVLVAAHDEEAVIGHGVESLRSQVYPPDRFEVFVVADRCSDATAERARQAGATVHERPPEASPAGKPAALRWLVERVVESGRSFDALCVFDADNLATPEFLDFMNRHLESGETCIQGYLDTKNPDDSWVAGSIAVAYWTTNRLWQRARHALGLCCALGGTGFCLDWDVALRLAWRNDCLTEDLDLQMQLVREGRRVSWAHEARVYDEKPLGLRASCRQRVRWMRGHWDVARRNFLPLVGRSIRHQSLVALDAAIYCLQPLRTVIGAAGMAGLGLAALCGSARAPELWVAAALIVPHFAYLANFCFAALPALGLLLERVPLRYWRFYPAAFVFGLTWIPIAFWGIVTSRRTKWAHTRHDRAVSIAARLALEPGRHVLALADAARHGGLAAVSEERP